MGTHRASEVTALRPDATERARPPEAPGRARLIRTAEVAGLGFGPVSLVWRATSTLHPEALLLSVALFLLELHAWIGLGLFTFSLWDVGGAPARPSHPGAG